MALIDTWQSTIATVVEEIPPPPPPPPPPGRATLVVNTIPVKGRIYLDGVYQGIAPVTLEVDPGTYVISFGDVEDYTTPEDVTVTLAGGDTVTIKGWYTPAGPAIPTWAWWAIGGTGVVGIGGLILYAVTRRR